MGKGLVGAMVCSYFGFGDPSSCISVSVVLGLKLLFLSVQFTVSPLSQDVSCQLFLYTSVGCGCFPMFFGIPFIHKRDHGRRGRPRGVELEIDVPGNDSLSMRMCPEAIP